MDKNTIFKWGFLLSLGLSIVLYYILDRKNRSLDKLIADIKLKEITSKLMDLNARATQSETEYKKAYEQYKALANMYPDIIHGLGLQFGPKGEQ